MPSKFDVFLWLIFLLQWVQNSFSVIKHFHLMFCSLERLPTLLVGEQSSQMINLDLWHSWFPRSRRGPRCCRWWTFHWSRTTSARCGTRGRGSLCSCTPRWCVPATGTGARTRARGTAEDRLWSARETDALCWLALFPLASLAVNLDNQEYIIGRY